VRCPDLNRKSQNGQGCWSQRLLTSVKGILFWGSGMICNLDTRAPILGVLEQIYKRAFIESVMRRFCIWRPVEIMDVSEST
jgi:hypothetical protein